MGTLWDEHIAVLVLVRHFGCLFCRQQIGQLLPHVSRIRAAGAEVVVVGNGSVEEARAFRDEQRLPVPLFTDPARDSYCALEMRRGVATVLHPRVILNSFAAMLQGFRQTKPAGDPLQQGGVVVMAPNDIERYRYVSKRAGDHPSPSAILRALTPSA